MKLILFRHGLAMERDDAIVRGLDDSQRPLVEKGRDRTRKMAKVLADLVAKDCLLLSSSLVRALETAKILRDEIKFTGFQEIPELVPEAPPQAFAKWLQHKAQRESCVVAVGHEPQLSVFASWCLTGKNESFIDFKKSGILVMETESFDTLGPNTAILKRLITPK